jgi:hypothetical protein
MKATVSTDTTTYTEEIEKGGLFRKAKTAERILYLVSFFVEFTEEERAILTKYDLWNTPVFTVQGVTNPEVDQLMRDSGMDVEPIYITRTIQHAAAPPDNEKPYHGDRQAYHTSVEALNFENELKSNYLPNIKRLIEATHASIGKSQTLEF